MILLPNLPLILATWPPPTLSGNVPLAAAAALSKIEKDLNLMRV